MKEAIIAAEAGLRVTPIEKSNVRRSDGGGFKVICRKSDFKADAVILAACVTRRKPGIPGELEFAVKGVSYCADGASADKSALWYFNRKSP